MKLVPFSEEKKTQIKQQQMLDHLSDKLTRFQLSVHTGETQPPPLRTVAPWPSTLDLLILKPSRQLHLQPQPRLCPAVSRWSLDRTMDVVATGSSVIGSLNNSRKSEVANCRPTLSEGHAESQAEAWESLMQLSLALPRAVDQLSMKMLRPLL